MRKLECFSHALVDKRQSVAVVAHLRLRASALLPFSVFSVSARILRLATQFTRAHSVWLKVASKGSHTFNFDTSLSRRLDDGAGEPRNTQVSGRLRRWARAGLTGAGDDSDTGPARRWMCGEVPHGAISGSLAGGDDAALRVSAARADTPRCALLNARGDGSGAFRLNADMTTEQAHQRLGIAEGVIHGLQEELKRVTAGHQAGHEALQTVHQ